MLPALPAGCSRISDGTGALLSPDGRLLVIARWRTILGRPVGGEEKEYFSDMGAEPLVPSLFVRNLVQDQEWRVPGWKPQAPNGVVYDGERRPVAWTPGGALLLADGDIIDPRSGAGANTVLRPVLSKDWVPSEETVRAWTWSLDGRRVAYFDQVPTERLGETGRIAPFALQAGETGRRIDLTRPHHGKTPAWEEPGAFIFGGRLSWSPGGEALLLRLRFNRVSKNGASTTDGVGLYYAEDGGVVVLGEFPHTDRAPSTTGEQVWDAAGRQCVFVAPVTTRPAAMAVCELAGGEHREVSPEYAWGGTTDVYVVDRASLQLRAVTHDGRDKREVCIDPAGRRVAFFVGDGRPRDWGNADSKARIRVVFLDGGRTWESPLAPPPDEWSRLEVLHWTPDGKRLLYGYGGTEGAVFAQEVPAVPP